MEMRSRQRRSLGQYPYGLQRPQCLAQDHGLFIGATVNERMRCSRFDRSGKAGGLYSVVTEKVGADSADVLSRDGGEIWILAFRNHVDAIRLNISPTYTNPNPPRQHLSEEIVPLR